MYIYICERISRLHSLPSPLTKNLNSEPRLNPKKEERKIFFSKNTHPLITHEQGLKYQLVATSVTCMLISR